MLHTRATKPGPTPIAPDDRGYMRLKVIANHPKASRPGWRDVDGAFGHGHIGVIDHEWLLVVEAPGQQRTLAIARTQHVKADPHVSREEALMVKRRLARRLDADKRSLPPSAVVLRAVVGRNHLDRANDCGIKCIKLLGRNPVFLVVGRTGDLHWVG
jgi:hypothetical protein